MTEAKSLVPTSCNTPLVTIDTVRAQIAKQAKEFGEARLIAVDAPTLNWLLNDAETLNRLISSVHHS